MKENVFRPMRRKRQELSKEVCEEMLRQGTSGVLALLGENDYPYAVPLSYVYCDGHLYFHSALRGHKVDAIRQCDKASFCVINQDCVKPKEFTTYFRSVIAFGRISIVEDETYKMQTLRLLAERYNPNDEEGFWHEVQKDFNHVLMMDLRIEKLSGKEAIELTRNRQTNE